MSRKREVTGTDARGRPVSTWADSAPDTDRGYGHMEPAFTATIERRQATPGELAAARAREVKPSHLSAPSIAKPATGPHIPEAERMQASRQRGAERHVEVVAARRPSPEPELSPEEPAMPEPKPLDTFEALAEAAAQASEAWAHRQAAQMAWEIAQEALEAALGEVDAILHPPVTLPAILVATTAPDELAPADGDLVDPPGDEIWRDLPATTPEPEPPATGGGPAKASKQEAVLEAVLRHGGDLNAVAHEIGTSRGNVTAHLHGAGQKHRLTIAHLAVLPAVFAKYSGV